MKYNYKKFKDLVHYIAASCEDGRRLGSVKLNKILWYSDCLAYQHLGKPITGSVYVKRQFGPVPKAILSALDDLAHEGRVIKIPELGAMGKRRDEFIPMAPPVLSEFSAEEISLVDQVVHWICYNHTAKSISDLTHDAIWEMAEIGEEIPLRTVLVSTLGEIDENDMAWATQAAERAIARAA